MIDPTKCKLEDSYCDGEFDCVVYYYTYPKELGALEFRYNEDTDENVVSACISLTLYDDGSYDMQISPTVEADDGLSDVGWFDLDEDVDYTEETVTTLLKMAEAAKACGGGTYD